MKHPATLLRILAAALLLALAGPARAQLGAWETRATMTIPRGEVAVCELGGKIYVAGGNGAFASPERSFQAYDPVADTWKTLAVLPPASGLYYAGAAGVNGKVYVFGGLKTTLPYALDTLYIYDVANNTWSQGRDLPTPRSAMGVAVINGKIYAAGGYPQGNGRSMTVYDPAQDSWTALATMPTGRDHLAAATLNGKFYAIGGRNVVDPPFNIVEEYDPAGNTWRTVTPMPTARADLAAAAQDGLIFVFGGNGNTADPNGLFNVVENYDPLQTANGLWQTAIPMPHPRHAIGAAAFNGRIYIPGGSTGAGFTASGINEAFVVSNPLPTFAELLAHLLGEIPRPPRADVTHDGAVDIADLLWLSVQ